MTISILKEYIHALITEAHGDTNEKAHEVFDMFSEKFLSKYNDWLKKGRYRYSNARIPIKHVSHSASETAILSFYVDDKPEPQYPSYKPVDKLSVLAYSATHDKVIIPMIIINSISQWQRRYGEFDRQVFYWLDSDLFIRLMKVANTYDELLELVKRFSKEKQ